MPNLFNRIEALWDNLKEGKAKTRAHFVIDRKHVDTGNQLGPRFKKEQHYFQVIINEIYLANERLWYKDYDPMAFVATSYLYDKGQLESLPVVVGPALLKQFQQEEVPSGMIFQNTPVSSFHPYQGGSLSLTIILNRLERKNNADKLLQVLENISGVIDLSSSLSIYLKVARTVLSGFEVLLGLQQTVPVAGYRITINPDIGQMLEPAYFVLIDADTQQIDRNSFWVRDSQLYFGSDLASAQPYRNNDFVLFSIAQGDSRSEVRTLPFYPLWEKTRDLAQQPGPFYKEEAKAQFNTLKRQIRYSPDLTKADAERLVHDYFAELEQLIHETEQESYLAPAQLPETEAELQRIATEVARL